MIACLATGPVRALFYRTRVTTESGLAVEHGLGRPALPQWLDAHVVERYLSRRRMRMKQPGRCGQAIGAGIGEGEHITHGQGRHKTRFRQHIAWKAEAAEHVRGSQ